VGRGEGGDLFLYWTIGAKHFAFAIRGKRKIGAEEGAGKEGIDRKRQEGGKGKKLPPSIFWTCPLVVQSPRGGVQALVWRIAQEGGGGGAKKGRNKERKEVTRWYKKLTFSQHFA